MLRFLTHNSTKTPASEAGCCESNGRGCVCTFGWLVGTRKYLQARSARGRKVSVLILGVLSYEWWTEGGCFEL